VSFLQFKVERDATSSERSTASCGVRYMNIVEEDTLIEARTCGDKNRRVAYKFMDAFHSLCLDKKDILLAEIGACETLLQCCHEASDRMAVEKEISELKMALDLMP
jgi:hypothetical protein